MEFFPPQPDLSLKISPPNTQNTSKIWQTPNQTHQDHGLNMGHFLNTLSSQNHHHGLTTRPNTPFGLYVPYQAHSNESNLTQITNTTNFHDQYHHQPQLGFLPPINGAGAPIYYQNTPHPNSNLHMLAQQYHQQINSQPSLDSCNIASSTSSSSLSHGNGVCHIARSRFLSARFNHGKRARAPRMRWTTTLHARFEHAVELLGGHERATPKAVLELMDVKDLTLAHVKSHLQMYRTIKTTDKALVSSGQSEVYENGSSADNYDDIMLGNQNQRTEFLAENAGRPLVRQDKEYGLWSNSSSREVMLHGKHADFEPYIPALEEMNLRGTKNERSSEVSSSSHSETSHKKPNLEFTLGSAH